MHTTTPWVSLPPNEQVAFFDEIEANAVLLHKYSSKHQVLSVLARPMDYSWKYYSQDALMEAQDWILESPRWMPWALVMPRVWGIVPRDMTAVLASDGKEVRAGWIIDGTFSWITDPEQLQDELGEYQKRNWTMLETEACEIDIWIYVGHDIGAIVKRLERSGYSCKRDGNKLTIDSRQNWDALIEWMSSSDIDHAFHPSQLDDLDE